MRIDDADPAAASIGHATRRAELCPGLERFITEAERTLATATGDPSTAGLRAVYGTFSEQFRRPRPADVAVRDFVLDAGHGGVPVRVYRPSSVPSHETGPCILYMHGGGWVLGSVDTHDCITAEIASRAAAVVVSVDYRLAPEHPFPAAFDDCRAVLAMAVRNEVALAIDARRVVVAGDSAGANLAAAIAIAARDDGGPALAGQALIYPVLCSELSSASYVENAGAPMLRTDEMADYWRLYLGGDARSRNPYAAPMAAADLAGLAPALILTAGHDPVRDDGAIYARRLAEAGVPVVYRCAPDLAHGYLRARTMSASAAAEFEALGGALRQLLT